MIKQEIKLGAEARKKLLKGINKLSRVVVSSLGPEGRNTIYFKDGIVYSTKDGVSIAKNIKTLEDPIEDLGAQMIKQASIKTAEKAGDGTTTSTLLAQEMINLGMKYLNNGENVIEIKKGIDNAVKKVIDYLQREISEEISSEEQLKQIATIAANNDVEIGKLIASALEKVGKNGVVHIEESKSGETYLEIVEGMQFDRGYKSHYFVTDNNTMSSVLIDPYILIADHKFTQIKELLPVLESVSSQDKSLLIIAEDIDNEALATLIVNKARGTLKVVAVKAPDFGDRKKLILEDIATLTGGVVFNKAKGMSLSKFSYDWFGKARTATITKESTTIIDGKGDEEKINKRTKELQTQIEKSSTPFEIEHLQNRLAKMSGGVSIIHVGGLTETEMNERKDRVDDALNVTKAALEEGIVPGGGVALLYAGEILKKESKTNIGAKIVYESCSKPFEAILHNCGFDDKISNWESNNLINGKDTWLGYDIENGITINMKDKGIIDPLKVTRISLQNAASVAGSLLLTEAIIYNLPGEEEKINPLEGMY